jgi:hypothetical protein
MNECRNNMKDVNYSRAPVSTDSLSAFYRGLKKNRKFKEMNGS